MSEINNHITIFQKSEMKENRLTVKPSRSRWLNIDSTMLYTYTVLNHYEGVYESYSSEEELYCGTMYVLKDELCTVVELTNVHRREEMSDN